MSANDNLLAGLAGLFSGIEKGFVPTFKEAQKFTLEQHLKKAEQDWEFERQKKLQDYKQQFEMEQQGRQFAQQSALEERKDTVLGSDILEADPKSVGIIPEKRYPKAVLPLIKGDLTLGLREDQRQDQLEKQYRDLHSKALSNRSGGLGLQDQKVNQAIHLRSLLDQYYDPKTGEYNVPKSQYEELAIGLANLIAGTNQATESMRQGIIQRTAKGDITGAFAYVTGTTPSASTQDVFKNLADSIDRQGTVSEDLRDKYFSQMRSKKPTALQPERAIQVEKENFGNSYKEHLANSPSNKQLQKPSIIMFPNDSDKQKRYEQWKEKKKMN